MITNRNLIVKFLICCFLYVHKNIFSNNLNKVFYFTRNHFVRIKILYKLINYISIHDSIK